MFRACPLTESLGGRDWEKARRGVVFASSGVNETPWEGAYAGYGEEHFALAERGRKPNGDARAYARAGCKGRSELTCIDGLPLSRRGNKGRNRALSHRRQESNCRSPGSGLVGLLHSDPIG